MGVPTRLRQVAIVAGRLAPVAEHLQTELRLTSPYHDPGVGEFGLENAVFSIGDTFVEVVAPIRAGSTAGRYLDKRGGDSGYMAIFQVPDVAEARRRVADLGVRVVWTSEMSDMAGTHLHPKDVPGAIVSLDWANPSGSWRWAGPAWTGKVPEHRRGGIVGLTVAARKPTAVAQRWADVLGVQAEVESQTESPDPPAAIRLDDGHQTLRFVSCDSDRSEGISEITVALERAARPSADAVDVGGVRFVLVPTEEEQP